jgi:hypothetical protein
LAESGRSQNEERGAVRWPAGEEDGKRGEIERTSLPSGRASGLALLLKGTGDASSRLKTGGYSERRISPSERASERSRKGRPERGRERGRGEMRETGRTKEGKKVRRGSGESRKQRRSAKSRKGGREREG